jgi:hypothetical protein
VRFSTSDVDLGPVETFLNDIAHDPGDSDQDRCSTDGQSHFEVAVKPTASLKIKRALASLKRLSPSRITRTR